MGAPWPGDFREAGGQGSQVTWIAPRRKGWRGKHCRRSAGCGPGRPRVRASSLGPRFPINIQRELKQCPGGSFQNLAFAWVVLLPGMLFLHRSKHYPSAASGPKGWCLNPWMVRRGDTLANRAAFYSIIQGLASLGRLQAPSDPRFLELSRVLSGHGRNWQVDWKGDVTELPPENTTESRVCLH